MNYHDTNNYTNTFVVIAMSVELESIIQIAFQSLQFISISSTGHYIGIL